MLYCGHCGGEVTADDRFCPGCGNKVNPPFLTQKPMAQPPQPPKPAKKEDPIEKTVNVRSVSPMPEEEETQEKEIFSGGMLHSESHLTTPPTMRPVKIPPSAVPAPASMPVNLISSKTLRPDNPKGVPASAFAGEATVRVARPNEPAPMGGNAPIPPAPKGVPASAFAGEATVRVARPNEPAPMGGNAPIPPAAPVVTPVAEIPKEPTPGPFPITPDEATMRVTPQPGGVPVAPPPMAGVVTDEPAFSQEKAPKKKKKWLKITLLSLLGLLLVLGLGFGHFGFQSFRVYGKYNDKEYQLAIEHYNSQVKGKTLPQAVLNLLYWNTPESIVEDCKEGGLDYLQGMEQLQALTAMSIDGAQKEYDNLIPLYLDHVVEQGEETNNKGEYEATLQAIAAAKGVLPAETDTQKLTALKEKTILLYQEQVKGQVDAAVAKNDYKAAFDLIAHAIEVEDNTYFQTLKEDTTSAYLDYVKGNALEHVRKLEFKEAMEELAAAVVMLPDNQELLTLYNEINSLITIQ